MKKAPIRYFLVGLLWIVTFVTFATAQGSTFSTTPSATTTAIPDQKIISRGKPSYQSSTYGNRVASNAVDGVYDSSNPDSCSTMLYNSSFSLPFISSWGSSVWWYVDLGDMYAVFSVTMYNAATLPDIIFFRDMNVVVSPNNQTSGQQCGRTYGQDTTQSGVVTVNCNKGCSPANYCNTFVYGRLVLIYKDGGYSSLYRNLTLCEVDVYGSKLILSPLDQLSQGKPASQPATYAGRVASHANDGIIDTTVADNCATSIAYHSYYNYYNPSNVYAWWQVDLQQVYAVASVQLILPQSWPDAGYIIQTQLPSVYVNSADNVTYGSKSQCYFNGVNNGNIYNYTCQYTLYTPYAFGRYVMVAQYSSSQYLAVITLCEVVVYGFKVQLALNDPSFSLEPTMTIDNGAKEDYNTYKSLAIAAIVIAGVTFLVLIVVFAVLIKFILLVKDLQAGKTSNAGGHHSRSNDYNNQRPERHSTSDGPDELYDDVTSGPQSDDANYELPPMPRGQKKK